MIELFHAGRQGNSDKMCQSFIHFQGGMKALTIPPSQNQGGGYIPPSPPGLTPMVQLNRLLCSPILISHRISSLQDCFNRIYMYFFRIFKSLYLSPALIGGVLPNQYHCFNLKIENVVKPKLIMKFSSKNCGKSCFEVSI